MKHNQWNEDIHREYPQRGLLYFADRYGVALSSFVLCFVIWVVTARAALDPPKNIAFFWLEAWIAVVIVLVVIRMGFFHLRDHNSDVARIYKTTPFKGLQGAIALLMACLLIVIIEQHELPDSLASYIWPMFIPGLIMGVQRLSERERPVHQSPLIPTQLSWLVMIYTGIAMYFMAYPARHFGLRYFISEMAGSIQRPAFLINGDFWRQISSLIVPFVPMIWTGVVLLTVYYALRRSDVHRVQNDLLTRLFEALVRMEEDPVNTWHDIASLIQRRLGYHRVFILVPDEHYRDAVAARTLQEREHILNRCQIEVLGSAGEGLDQMQYKRFPVTTGLARYCFDTGETVLELNVKSLSPSEYVDGGFKDTLAELQVPIRDIDRNDIVLVGILVAQQTKPFRLTERDVQTLRRVSRFLASYSRKFDSMWGYRRLEAELDEATSDHFSRVTGTLRVLKRMCKSSSVAYIPLGFANRCPLTDQITTLDGGFERPEKLTCANLYSADSPILTTIKTSQPQFYNASQDDASKTVFPPAWREWMQREKLGSIALIPVGEARYPSGIFVVGFARLISGIWSDMERALASFGQAATPYLRNGGDRLSVYQQTFLPQFASLHFYVNAEDLGRTALLRKLENIDRMTRSEVKDFGSRMLRVMKRLYEAEDMRPPDSTNPSLESSLGKFREALKTGRGHAFELEWRVDSRIELEGIELKVILFRCITEAVFNSLNQGRATMIYVRAARLRNCIWLVISDNGSGFDPTQSNIRIGKAHVSGIHHMGDCLQDLCGASKIDWAWTAPGVGACLKLVIPMLPDPALPEQIIVQDHLDSLEVLHDKERFSTLNDK